MPQDRRQVEALLVSPIYSISSEDSHRGVFNAQRSRGIDRGGLSDPSGQVQRLDIQRLPARQLLRELTREEELPYLHADFMSEAHQTSRMGEEFCYRDLVPEMGLCLSTNDTEHSSSGRDSLDSCFDFNVREHLQRRGLAPIIFPAPDNQSAAIRNGIELPSVWFSPSDQDYSLQCQRSGKYNAEFLSVSTPATKSSRVLRKTVLKSPKLGRCLGLARVVSGRGELERPRSSPQKTTLKKKKSHSQTIRSNHLLESAEDSDSF